VLAESPTFVCCAQRGLIFSGNPTGRGPERVPESRVCWLFMRDFVNYLVRTSVGRCPVSPPEKIRPRLAESTNSGLSASTVRVPKIAQQFWSSCAAAEFVDGAVAFSGGLTGERPTQERHKIGRWSRKKSGT
jgi:hypothetical protein